MCWLKLSVLSFNVKGENKKLHQGEKYKTVYDLSTQLG